MKVLLKRNSLWVFFKNQSEENKKGQKYESTAEKRISSGFSILLLCYIILSVHNHSNMIKLLNREDVPATLPKP